MSETQSTILKYQWIKGDHTGKVETFVDTENGFMVFESKRKVKTELLGEFMILVNSDTDILNLTPPQAIDIEAETGLKYENSSSSPTIEKPAQKVEPKNPIRTLLEKQSKNNKIKIELEFDVNVPKKEVVGLLQDTFEEDVKEEVIKFSKDKLNKSEIIDKVYSQLEEVIKIYYS
jgi:hypothetical protein